MNKIFKKVWNRRRGCFVAVSEAMSSAAQSSGKATVITAGLVLGLVSTPSYAIYKHIYAGESTAGQNLDYAEQDYSLNLHGNYTVGAGSNVSCKKHWTPHQRCNCRANLMNNPVRHSLGSVRRLILRHKYAYKWRMKASIQDPIPDRRL